MNEFPLTPNHEYQLDAALHHWRSGAVVQWLVERRRELANAFIDLDFVVLKPICDQCRYRMSAGSWYDAIETRCMLLWPELLENRVRLYDAASQCVTFWPHEPDQEYWPIRCIICGDTVSSRTGDDIISVVPYTLTEYFGLDTEGPKRVRDKKLRLQLLELYGNECFGCNRSLELKDVTLDHIVAKSKSGQGVPQNLQVLCLDCNQNKADQDVDRFTIALDFPLRPAPWETYEGPIW